MLVRKSKKIGGTTVRAKVRRLEAEVHTLRRLVDALTKIDRLNSVAARVAALEANHVRQ